MQNIIFVYYLGTKFLVVIRDRKVAAVVVRCNLILLTMSNPDFPQAPVLRCTNTIFQGLCIRLFVGREGTRTHRAQEKKYHSSLRHGVEYGPIGFPLRLEVPHNRVLTAPQRWLNGVSP